MSNGISGQPATPYKHTFATGTECYRARAAAIRRGESVSGAHRTKETFWFKSNVKD
jgi:hypothetical protein